jgi:hypothetical protein
MLHAVTARSLEDAEVFLLSNDLTVLRFRGHLSQVVGIDPLSREGLVCWSAQVVDVYSHGVFAAAEDEGGA